MSEHEQQPGDVSSKAPSKISSRDDFSYNPTVMDHFQNPRNAGEVKNPDAIAQTRNPNCGDAISLSIKVTDDILTEIKFLTFGCGAAIATCSMATDLVSGKPLDQAEALSAADVISALGGLPEHKEACANLAPEALKLAIADYRKRNLSNIHKNK
ncbi:MAG: iron-sulfur cluster assembly scaffold protein [candidate division Zixibacteria bacterium]|nr:iron-sulfur cluster assembly scaffold protein [candidate division Zixibacteria bacterium]